MCTIEFILFRFQFPFKSVNVAVELRNALTVGLAVTQKLVSKGVNAFVLFLSVKCCLFLLKVEFVLKSVGLSAKGQFALLFLKFLLLSIANQILNF